MLSWRTIQKTGALAFLAVVSWNTTAATIYGVIVEKGKPVKAEVKLVCGATEQRVNTDAQGTYSISLNAKGDCTLWTDGATAPVVLYDRPTRYNFELSGVGAQRRLTPK